MIRKAVRTISCVVAFCGWIPTFAWGDASIHETFKTEFGETVRCDFSSRDPDISPKTLDLWLKLRYPYESFGFPDLVEASGSIHDPAFIRKAKGVLETQRRVIRSLRTQERAEIIRPLHDAVTETFQREEVYGRALLILLEKRTAEEFVRVVGEGLELDSDRRQRVLAMARTALAVKEPGALRTFRDQFFSEYIMVDRQGRHFSDYHREFIRKHGITIECSCLRNC